MGVMVTPDAVSADDRMAYARTLVEIGEPYDAELQLAQVLEERPDDLGALDLLAKIKHMRGELTEAIALWAQVHERSPRNQTGLLRLSSMLQLARDAERGGGEFLVLGHFQLWRKPAAHLELEDVFRTFLARRPDKAKERYEERFVDLFRRRMHRPTRRDAIRSAARWYIPLRSLEAVRFTDASTEAADASTRERAIEMALSGDRSGARARLLRSADALDL